MGVCRGSSLYTYVELVTTKLSYKVHLLQCLKGIDLKVLGLNGLKRKVRLENRLEVA